MAWRSHPFPSRTRKLSSIAPMILGGRPPGKLGRRRTGYSSLAQSVEHAAVNRRVVGSSPTGGANSGPLVKRPKTPPFHGGNTSSNLVRVTKWTDTLIWTMNVRIKMSVFIFDSKNKGFVSICSKILNATLKPFCVRIINYLYKKFLIDYSCSIETFSFWLI